MTTTTFADLLDLLGYEHGEHLSINTQPAGGRFTSTVTRHGPNIPDAAIAMADGVHGWFGVNPVHPNMIGRGGVEDITRLAAIYADLDVKPGACRDLDHAHQIIDTVAGLLGTRPSALVYTGGGVQPYWPIEDNPINTEQDRAEAVAALRRFGRLVHHVAAQHGAQVDSVFDLARVLRIPGTRNHKTVPAVPVTAQADTGAPLGLAELDERLDEAGIPERDTDRAAGGPGETVSPPAVWQYAVDGAVPCDYADAMIRGWANDNPPARHPWLVSQATRIAAAHRSQCLTPELHRKAVDTLARRFADLCARGTDPRPVAPYEVRDAIDYGQRLVAGMTDERLAAELGQHVHLGEPELMTVQQHAQVVPLHPDTGEPAGPPTLAQRLLTRSALNELPDPEPLIDNVLDRGTTALLYGRWGTGKSFVALDWAASVATGRRWQERASEHLRVLYVAAEGAFGMKARTHAWETGWGTKISDEHLHVLPTPVNLTRPGEVRELAALIDTNGYDFIVLDTLARCMAGADENSAQDCGIVVEHLDLLRRHTPGGRGVVLGVHHTGKDGLTMRGSSALEGGVDTVYRVTADGGVSTLERRKRKDGPEDDVHHLKLAPIEGTGSVVLECLTPDFGVRHRTRTVSLMSQFMSHFAATGATGSQLLEVTDLPRATAYRALNDLLQRGELVNVGTEKRPFYKLPSK